MGDYYQDTIPWGKDDIVEITLSDENEVVLELSDEYSFLFLQPKEARKIGEGLIKAANHIEGLRKDAPTP